MNWLCQVRPGTASAFTQHQPMEQEEVGAQVSIGSSSRRDAHGLAFHSINIYDARVHVPGSVLGSVRVKSLSSPPSPLPPAQTLSLVPPCLCARCLKGIDC